MTTHTYRTRLRWAGSTGEGYRGFTRNHTMVTGGGSRLALSADVTFRGDPMRANPEELLVSATSSCQLLSFLAVAARAGVDVIGYHDDATGVMPKDNAPTRITQIELRPVIRVSGPQDHAQVHALVARANQECYIANSLNSAVSVVATVEVLDA